MDEAFAESLVHAPRAHVVLGRRLRPFSFWHSFALDALGSPFAGHPGPLDLAALDTAVRVCQSQRPHLISNSEFRIPNSLRACLLQYRYGRFLIRELTKFIAYRRDYDAPPTFGQTAGSEPVKSPWHQVVVFRLLREDPVLAQLAQHDAAEAEQRAWMMPIGYGLWRLTGLAEARGEKVNIMTEADRKAFARGGHAV